MNNNKATSEIKLIVGLGNPGKEYEKTKHNIGFLFLDFLQDKEGFPNFKQENKFKGEISSGFFLGKKSILLKPITYMNLSGESIRKVIDFYKIPVENIIIIYDDMSMDFGKIRFRKKGSAGGHNGIKSIIQHIGENFKRIKIGIGYNENFEVSDWVLSKFNDNEINLFEKEIFKNTYNLLTEKIKND